MRYQEGDMVKEPCAPGNTAVFPSREEVIQRFCEETKECFLAAQRDHGDDHAVSQAGVRDVSSEGSEQNDEEW